MSELILTGVTIAIDQGATPWQDQVLGSQNTPRNHWLEQGSILICDGKIAGIFEDVIVPKAISDHARVVQLDTKVVLPALVNGHTHLSQTFMRGLASGRSLLRWLKELIWPLQGAYSPELLELAALLGLVENTRSGDAHVVNHHKVTRDSRFSSAVVWAARQSRLRVTIVRAWADC